MRRVGEVRRALCELTGASEAALLVGSGTLANEVVATCIAGLDGHGLILANGEFGERLVDHAHCAGLRFDALRKPWGEPFRELEIVDGVRRARAAWLWAVHCETSTGVLNDTDMLRRAAAATHASLCLDCISSIGTVDLDLAGIRLASGASGKGLGAYPGLAIVFCDSPPPRPGRAVPRYLDLGHWLAHDSVPFTHSSNLVAALGAALERLNAAERMARTGRDARWLRFELRRRNLRPVAPEAAASPAVTTVALPPQAPSFAVAAALEQSGYLVSWRSEYLLKRNWIQVALMGEYDPGALRGLPGAMAQAVSGNASSAWAAA